MFQNVHLASKERITSNVGRPIGVNLWYFEWSEHSPWILWHATVLLTKSPIDSSSVLPARSHQRAQPCQGNELKGASPFSSSHLHVSNKQVALHPFGQKHMLVANWMLLTSSNRTGFPLTHPLESSFSQKTCTLDNGIIQKLGKTLQMTHFHNNLFETYPKLVARLSPQGSNLWSQSGGIPAFCKRCTT